jgi:GNAT superfamily N-acetyltransferase
VVVGSGLTDRSDLAGRGAAAPRVLPAYRRQGVGSLILRDLAARAAAAGHTLLGSGVDDPGSFAFARYHGFVEVDRQVEQVRAIGAEPYPAVPPGLEIVTVADRPELWPLAYQTVAVEAMKDMAVASPMQVSLEQWERDWINAPQASFLGLVDGELVGLASLHLDSDVPERAEQGFTAVRAAWRGRGIAATLKRVTLWWAAEHGIREVYTWTQTGNENMRTLNEHLGFRYGQVSIDVVAPLPLS